MRRVNKLLVFVVVLLFGVNMLAISASAQTITQDGLVITLTTDKEEYLAGEEVKLILTVKNTSEEKVTGIKIEDVISDAKRIAILENVMNHTQRKGPASFLGAFSFLCLQIP